jgi:error-prone DNA polymerase
VNGVDEFFDSTRWQQGDRRGLSHYTAASRHPKGLIFLTLEDETGNSNIIVMPDVYEKNRRAVLEPRFVRISGTVQNQDGIVHLRAENITPLVVSAAQVWSHDFH